MKESKKTNIEFEITVDGEEIPMRVSLKAYGIHLYYFKKGLVKALIANIEPYSNNPHWKEELKRNTKLAQIIWTFAKNANAKLPLFEEWLDSVDELPIRSIMPKIIDALVNANTEQGKLKGFSVTEKNILLKNISLRGE